MEKLLKLTDFETKKTILIGVESIISVQDAYFNGKSCVKIISREAMATNNWVVESVEDIYKQYKGN